MNNKAYLLCEKVIVSKVTASIKYVFIIATIVTSCSPQTKEKSSETETKIVSTDTIINSPKQEGSDCKQLLAEAKKMDSILLKALDVNTDVAKKGIKTFTDFAYFCPTDSLSPIYLIKTAQVAQSINNSTQAKIVLEKCIADYPKSIHRPTALFLLAQLYDEVAFLNNEAEAKKLYEEIINNYPNSDWAKSAKGALNFIGKTDEQILEQLKKK